MFLFEQSMDVVLRNTRYFVGFAECGEALAVPKDGPAPMFYVNRWHARRDIISRVFESDSRAYGPMSLCSWGVSRTIGQVVAEGVGAFLLHIKHPSCGFPEGYYVSARRVGDDRDVFFGLTDGVYYSDYGRAFALFSQLQFVSPPEAPPRIVREVTLFEGRSQEFHSLELARFWLLPENDIISLAGEFVWDLSCWSKNPWPREWWYPSSAPSKWAITDNFELGAAPREQEILQQHYSDVARATKMKVWLPPMHALVREYVHIHGTQRHQVDVTVIACGC